MTAPDRTAAQMAQFARDDRSPAVFDNVHYHNASARDV